MNNNNLNKSLIMVKGDTFAFGLEFEGLDQDLDSAYFSCKKNISDETYTFQKTLEDGIEKVETNKYRVRVAPEDTADVEAGKYYYDLQIGANDDVYTIIKGVLTIESEITGD